MSRRQPTDPTAGASYSRYSSDMQQPASISDQQRKCRSRAESNGHRILPANEFYDAAVSGTKADRAGLNALIQAAKAGRFSVLYLENLNRLARESVISMPLIKTLVYRYHIRIISIDEGIDTTNEGWDLSAAVSSIFAEKFTRDLGKSVFRGQVGNVAEGFSVGDMCYGYASEAIPGTDSQRRGRNAKPRMRYIIDPTRSVWVWTVFYMFSVERRSLADIARELNRLNVPKDHRATTPRWYTDLVRRMLSNSKYVGIWSWGQRQNHRDPLTGKLWQELRPESETDQYTRTFPDLRIVPQDWYDTAQELLKDNSRRHAGWRRQDGKLSGSGADSPPTSPRHLLAGLIRCGACGAPFCVGGANGRYLICPKHRRGQCGCQAHLDRELAEQLIVRTVSDQISSNEEWRRAIFDATLAAWKHQSETRPDEIRSTMSQLASIKMRIQRLIDKIEEGHSSKDLQERLSQRIAERNDLERRLATLQKKTSQITRLPDEAWVFQQLSDLLEVLHDGAPNAALALRRLVGDEIIVDEVLRPGRKRRFLRGTIKLHVAFVGETMADSTVADPAIGPIEFQLDFVKPTKTNALMHMAKELYDKGLLQSEIANRLNVSESWVCTLLRRWGETNGQHLPSGYSRRSQIMSNLSSVPKHELIVDQVMKLFDEGVLLVEIAAAIGCSRDTIRKAVAYWHEAREVRVPDGRARRKALSKKQRRTHWKTSLAKACDSTTIPKLPPVGSPDSRLTACQSQRQLTLSDEA